MKPMLWRIATLEGVSRHYATSVELKCVAIRLFTARPSLALPQRALRASRSEVT